MKTIDIIKQKISKISTGKIFTYNDFPKNPEYREALYKGLNRMATSGQIAKLSKGKFYKPRNTTFGQLKPSLNEQIKDLLIQNGKTIGYISGFSALNYLGLTTQVANTITIYTQVPKKPISRGTYKICFSQQKNVITKSNIKLLMILDGFCLINRIPDADPANVYCKFKQSLEKLTIKEIENIVKLSFKYPPRTRALLGAFLEDIRQTEFNKKIRVSLSCSSSYKAKIVSKQLKSAVNWNLK
ncbi:MAG: hypothetical protein K2Q03_08330 [Sphingobacteriaceae bacterium]|nr:hypothetical protein [Sphingobacteriaceae bacterium]